MSKIEVEDIPAWVSMFMAHVSQMYEIGNPSDKAIGWTWYRNEENIHEVFMYPSIVEVEGEPRVPGDIQVDVASLLDQFEQVENIELTINNNQDDELLLITGKVNGNDMHLHLLGGPPEDEVPITRMRADGGFEDIEPNTEGRS